MLRGCVLRGIQHAVQLAELRAHLARASAVSPAVAPAGDTPPLRAPHALLLLPHRQAASMAAAAVTSAHGPARAGAATAPLLAPLLLLVVVMVVVAPAGAAPVQE